MTTASLPAGGRACHDGCGLARLQNWNVFVSGAGFDFSDHVEPGGKLREIGRTDGVPVAHGPGKRRKVAVGEDRLGQHLPVADAVQQLHQFLTARTKGGSVAFHQVTRFLEAQDQSGLGTAAMQEMIRQVSSLTP